MANLAQIIPAFFTGPNGQRLTPDQIAERQQIAQSLMAQATDTSPNAGGVASILAKGLQGFQAGRARRQADGAIGANASASQANLQTLLGGLTGSTGGTSQGATVASPVVGGGQSASVPQTVDISGDKQTFIQSLLPAAIEEGARTGVDPRIIVAQAAQETGWGKSAPGNNYFGIKSHGQSGGQTLATNEVIDGKTVRINDSFRQFASPADSVKGYGDFILQNPRYKPLREAQGIDAQLQALQASGYATDPNYSRSVGAIARSIQLPQPSTAPMVSAQPVNAAQAPNPQIAQAVAPQPAMTAPAQQPLNPAVIEALSSPYASEQERSVAGLLLNQHMSQQQAAQQQALAQQQRQQEIARRQQIAQQAGIDPAYAQDDELWKGATGNLFAAPSTTTVGNSIIDNRTGQPIYQGAPERQPLMNLGDGTVYDPNAPQDQRFIQAPNGSRGFRQANADEIKAYGTNGQVGPDGKFYPITPPQGTALSVDPTTGAVTFNQGAGVKLLTEVQSKDSFFTTRMTAANPTLEANETALLNLGEKAAGSAPLGMGNYLQSEQYQLARDAGRDFVTAYLRKDSGAALTPAEERLYGELLLPQPGDKPATIELKRQRRQVAVEAIKSGMPPQAVDGVLKAIKAVPGAESPTTPSETPTPSNGSGWREVSPGIRIRPKGGN